jgi:hypothetical protein
MTRLHKPYRPSNGTEGECFISSWCGTCERSGGPGKPDDVGEELTGCSITGRTMLYDIEDADYPAEWILVDGNPRCTAWIPLGDPIPAPRCQDTIDMFDPAGPFTASSRARVKP